MSLCAVLLFVIDKFNVFFEFNILLADTYFFNLFTNFKWLCYSSLNQTPILK